MGEAKRRRNAKMKAMSVGIEPEQGEALVRQAFLNTCLAMEREPDLLNAVLTTYNHRNATLDLVNSKNPRDAIACRAGCSACCHQMVACSPFEILIIAQFLLMTRSDDELSAIIHRLQKQSKLPVTPEARYGPDKPCPLLDDAICSVYERRPSVCRTVFSNSKRRCDEALANGDGEIGYLLYPPMFSSALQIGIDAALNGKARLSTEEVELCGSLLTALADFDRSLDEWLRGGDPFSQWHVRQDGYPTNRESVEIVAERFGLWRLDQ